MVTGRKVTLNAEHGAPALSFRRLEIGRPADQDQVSGFSGTMNRTHPNPLSEIQFCL